MKLRVSMIASIEWCEIKAKKLMEGFEIPETEEMKEGDKWHDAFGFNQNIPVLMKYKDYEIEGHIDKLIEIDGEKMVLEFKTTSGKYPIEYLVRYAHAQANLYASMIGANKYAVLVFFVDDGIFIGNVSTASKLKAEIDITRAISLLEGKANPVPTSQIWKCFNCPIDCDHKPFVTSRHYDERR